MTVKHTARKIWGEAGKPLSGALLDNLLDEIEMTGGGKEGRVEFLRQLSQSNLERAGVKFDGQGNAMISLALWERP